MQRFGRVLRLRPGAEEEYERLHAEVWPEVVKLTKEMGISNYTIFRYECWLFSYFELPEGLMPSDVGGRIESSETCRKWEETMHALQEPLPESRGDSWWVSMREVWHLD